MHRVGRTARAGKRGEGLLLLADFESYFVRTALSDVPITPAPPALTASLPAAVAEVDAALARVDEETKASAYRTFLGYYKGFLKQLRWTPDALVAAGTAWSRVLRCGVVPPTIESVEGFIFVTIGRGMRSYSS